MTPRPTDGTGSVYRTTSAFARSKNPSATPAGPAAIFAAAATTVW